MAEQGGGGASQWQHLLRQLADALAGLLPPALGSLVLGALDALGARLALAAAAARGRLVAVAGRRLALGRVLGEGGYATVFLARDAADPSGRPYALKRVADGGGAAARREEEALREAKGGAGVVPLLGSARPLAAAAAAAGMGGAGAGAEGPLLLLFPAYEGGTLHEELAGRRRRRAGDGGGAGRGSGLPTQPPPPLHAARLLPAADVLSVAARVGGALAHVHARGWVHRDVKPHNIMMAAAAVWPGRGGVNGGRRRRRRGGGGGAYGRVGGGSDDDDDDDTGDDGGGDEGGGEDDVEMAPLSRHPPPPPGAPSPRPAPPPALVVAAPEHNSPFGSLVLIDFGSAARWPLRVRSPRDARREREDAEAHATAQYRAPELFDVPVPCDLGPAIDVWSLGCTLFACMHGSPPFEPPRAGDSVALAVLAGRVPWPAPAPPPAPPPPACDGDGNAGAPPLPLPYPPALVELVRACLATDPARRPSAAAVARRARELLDSGAGAEDGGGRIGSD